MESSHLLRPFLSLALSLACSSSLAGADRLRVEGSDTIGGSLGLELAEAFNAFHPGILVEWEGLGSSTAFIGLFDGSADLGASSRPINEAELAEARALGLKLKELVLAYDGMSVFVHPSNEVPVLTLEQLSRIFQGRVTNFREVGGPDRPIRLLSRPSYSGTHAFFRDKVLRRGNAKGPEEFAASTEWVEHTADIVERVARDPNAISYGGMAYARPKVRVVPVAAARGRPGVLPAPETVRDGSYPIFRPLYLYARGEPQGRVRELLDFILGVDGQKLVAEVGFVPASLEQSPAAVVARATAARLAPAPQPATTAPQPAAQPTAPPVAPGASLAALPATTAPAQVSTAVALSAPPEPTRV